MANSHPYLNNLTPLRGAAALWVATYHIGNIIKLFQPGQTMLVNKGYLMVDLFLIMSGFIIRHVYGDRFSREITTLHIRRFFVARVARIYPLHFFTLLFLIVMTWYTGMWNIVNDPGAIMTNLLLLQSFGLEQLSTWNRASWSLSAEWAAYMVCPLLALLFGRKKRLTYFLLPALIIIAYTALVYWLPPKGIGNANRLILHKLDVTYNYGFIRGVAGFTLGMLTYGLYTNDVVRHFFSRDIVAVFFILMTALLMHEGVNDLFLLLPFAGLVISFACNSGYLHQFCSLRPAQFVGKVSYSIYLIQPMATLFFVTVLELPGMIALLHFSFLLSFLQRLAYTVAYLSVLIGLSTLTYYGIENPCRNFINRYLIEEKRISSN